MYNEIDLHNLDYKVALALFKKKYNDAIKRKDKREILIIHGYGANKLEHNPVLATNIRLFLSKNKDKLSYRLDINPGVTYVTPIFRLEWEDLMYIKLKNKKLYSDLEKLLLENDIKFFTVDDIRIALLYVPKAFDFKKLEKFEDNIELIKIKSTFKFASREFKEDDTVINVKNHLIGGNNFMLMAGPCSVENKEMLSNIAKEVKKGGAIALRGGAYKPRTSPYDFQGLGEIGLKYLREVADENDMLVVTEVMDSEDIDLVLQYTDIVQIGARNMQNFSLLKKLGKIDKPVLLKRGLSATINEFLLSAEYIIAHGNRQVILCERGIRTFETMTRNTVDINGLALVRELSHLPIIIDASHGTGKRSLVEPVTLAGIVAGANGAMVEVHENPECALSDGPQSLNFEMFEKLSKNLKKALKFRGELE